MNKHLNTLLDYFKQTLKGDYNMDGWDGFGYR